MGRLPEVPSRLRKGLVSDSFTEVSWRWGWGMIDRARVLARPGERRDTTYFLEGPYLCAGIQTDCGDAGKAQLRGRFHHTRGLDTCSLSFLFLRDLKVTTGVKKMNVYQLQTLRLSGNLKRPLLKREIRQVSGQAGTSGLCFIALGVGGISNLVQCNQES